MTELIIAVHLHVIIGPTIWVGKSIDEVGPAHQEPTLGFLISGHVVHAKQVVHIEDEIVLPSKKKKIISFFSLNVCTP